MGPQNNEFMKASSVAVLEQTAALSRTDGAKRVAGLSCNRFLVSSVAQQSEW